MLTLHAGESSLVLAPEIGGAIVGWTFGAIPLLRRPEPDAIVGRNARGLGCFPLVPFSNRIDHGRFRWDGCDHVLEHNFGDRPHCIHGIGWQSVWDTAAVSTTFAILSLRHDAIGDQARRWPFSFTAEQRFTLTQDALQVVLTLTNRHPHPAPAGLGLHPYFPRAGMATLRFKAQGVWSNGADMLPAARVRVPPEWDHTPGLKVGRASLDNCFADWGGQARVDWASAGPSLTIEADDVFRHLIVYTPRDHDFFCVEPVSHMTDALNRMGEVPDHGMSILPPGGTLQGEVTFRLKPRNEATNSTYRCFH
jgi:aldose 1-epimerase